jgi:hypothetical protein
MVQIHVRNIDITTLIIITAFGVIAGSSFMLMITHLFYSDLIVFSIPVNEEGSGSFSSSGL